MKRSRAKHTCSNDSDDAASRQRQSNKSSSSEVSTKERHDKVLSSQSSMTLAKEGDSHQHSIITTLPTEIVIHILVKLGTRDLIACLLTCHQWRNIIKSHPSLLLHNLELQGCLHDIRSQWHKIQGLQLEAPVVDSVKIVYKEPSVDFSDDDSLCSESEEEYRENVVAEDHRWLCGFLESFPFATLQHLDYNGLDAHIDGDLWHALNACEQLKSIRFKSRSKWMYSPELMYSEIKGGSLRQCKMELIEIDVDCDVILSNFNLDRLTTLVFKTVMYFGNVDHYIKKAASTLEELQICGVEYEKIYYSRMLEHHDGQCEEEAGNEDTFCHCISRELSRQAEEIHGRDCLSLPVLKVFKAISNDPFATVQEEQERGPYGTTVKDFKIWAPNVSEMVYKNYFGWDKTLFESCYTNLKKVHFEINRTNVNNIFEAVKKLIACEELSLVSTSCLFDSNINLPLHPFGGDASDATSIPCKQLTKLKQLTIVGEEKITGAGLIRLVKYKKDTSDCEVLERLSLHNCPSVEKAAIEELAGMCPSLDVK